MTRLFSLTKKVSLVLKRGAKGSYSDTTGKFVKGTSTQVTIQANVQPLKYSEVMMEEGADRTREWVAVFSSSEIRKSKEGANGWDADTFTWNNDTYRVMSVCHYQMGILDHYHAKAALDSPSARSS